MKIDYNKLVELLLPTFLRRPRILALLRVLVAKPLQQLFVRFHIWRLQSRYEASVSPQVCSLIHAIERTFDCVAEITELDGKPYDFLVSIDRSADLNAIREFIDKHKLAGKSYIFQLGDAVFSVTWLNHVDEHLIEEYAAEWVDYIDSKVMPCYVRIFYTSGNDVDSPYPRGMVIEVTTDEPVRSKLDFTININVTDSEGVVTNVVETLTLEAGNTMAGHHSTQLNISGNVISGMNVTPKNDIYYYYDPVDVNK